jgi:hypothetical protein
MAVGIDPGRRPDLSVGWPAMRGTRWSEYPAAYWVCIVGAFAF